MTLRELSEYHSILIIKTGASGDVVRTTCLLQLFPDAEIDWVTKALNMPLLPQHKAGLKIHDIAVFTPAREYDLVISLDDENMCAELASSTKYKELVGVYMQEGKPVYRAVDTTWFDMSLISVHGRVEADRLKLANTLTFQEHLFALFGLKFKGETYVFNESVTALKSSKTIGIESRAGARWPTKVWNKYPQLAESLRMQGYDVVFFEERENILDYAADIAKCCAVVCGDTLAMHIALALNIPTVSIFTCTSAVEIYTYGIMNKVISPYLAEAFYQTEYNLQAVDSIGVETVKEALFAILA